MKRTLIVVLSLLLAGCATTQPANNNQPSSQPAAANQPATASQPTAVVKPISELKEGEASGSILVEGQTINLKYAYAGHGEMFDETAVRFMLTEAPLAPETVTKFFETSYAQFPKDSRGLEYKVGKGFWVMYNPDGFQTSGINTLKDYSVENGLVKGHDEDTDNFDNKVYKRSVSFVARLPEKTN